MEGVGFLCLHGPLHPLAFDLCRTRDLLPDFQRDWNLFIPKV